MVFKDINQKFTDKVAEYIQKGFLINTGTMRGMQSELAKVDLTDGEHLYRIMLTERHADMELDGCRAADIDLFSSFEFMICLTVEKSEEKVDGTCKHYSTIWNRELETIECEKFYQIGCKKNGDAYYGTREECIEACEKRIARRRLAVECRPQKTARITSEKTVDAVLPYLKRKRDGRRINRSMVEVYRTTQADGSHGYDVTYYSYGYHLA